LGVLKRCYIFGRKLVLHSWLMPIIVKLCYYLLVTAATLNHLFHMSAMFLLHVGLAILWRRNFLTSFVSNSYHSFICI